MLNSFYGAYGNSNFRYYSTDHARSITLSGQALIRHITDKANEWLKSIFKTDYDFQIYNDTDSCVGSTQVYLGENQTTIEELYNTTHGVVEVRGPDNYIKHVTEDITTKTVSSGEVVNKKIKYIMKHKVKKKMYKVSVNGRSVIVTEDHSVMVLRDGNLVEVKPAEILYSDTCIVI
jgi:DNA polymerase elongation subunit (family B)